MITVDTRGTTAYSPLIPAIKAMCNAVPGETLEIIMNHAEASAFVRSMTANS